MEKSLLWRDVWRSDGKNVYSCGMSGGLMEKMFTLTKCIEV